MVSSKEEMPMPKQKLAQYKATLSPAEIAAGMDCATANACRLCEDAELLLAESRYPSALSLAALSIEESGKLPVLRALAVARDEKELSDAWREYRSHTHKNRMWPFLELFTKGAKRLGDFRSLFEDGTEHPYLLDSVKQLGFYTDCLGKMHWSVPSEVIGQELASAVVRTARLLLPKRKTSAREVELWIEYVGPVWKGPMEHMEAAVAAWHRQMCQEGLLEGDAEAMERFIVDGTGQSTETEDSSDQ